MQLIGLNGFMESGKNTLADLMALEADLHGETLMQKGFAHKLKQAAATALGFEGTLEECVAYCDHLKEHGWIHIPYDTPEGDTEDSLSFRTYLQLFGTEVGRKLFGDSFWVDQVVPMDELAFAQVWDTGVDDIFATPPDWGVITDCRFPNEATRILDAGGMVVEIIRPGQQEGAHDSEKRLPPELVTCVIHNDGDLLALRRKGYKLMESLRG